MRKKGPAASIRKKERRTVGQLLFGPLKANMGRAIRKALGLPPRPGRRWNKKVNKAGKVYWTATGRPLDCGFIISGSAEGYLLKTIADGTFTEVKTTYTVRGAKRSAEDFIKQQRGVLR